VCSSSFSLPLSLFPSLFSFLYVFWSAFLFCTCHVSLCLPQALQKQVSILQEECVKESDKVNDHLARHRDRLDLVDDRLSRHRDRLDLHDDIVARMQRYLTCFLFCFAPFFISLTSPSRFLFPLSFLISRDVRQQKALIAAMQIRMDGFEEQANRTTTTTTVVVSRPF
jgi:hypothetical protein